MRARAIVIGGGGPYRRRMIRTSWLLPSLVLVACGSKPAPSAPAPSEPAAKAAEAAPASDAPTCCCESVENGLENYAMMTEAECTTGKDKCTDASWCSSTDE